MRIISVYLENFASYQSLEFDFSNQGLSLIHGATGSGKSTLCDAIPWILFGRTAKNGAVDEVLSWPGSEVVEGRVGLVVNNQEIMITRLRGNKSKDNDLYYRFIPDLEEKRGKDLNDTQKLINNLLGIDCDLYLAAAYYHEFSQTAQFFTTTAKNRRMICEQIVDLSLAKKLQPALSEKKKEISKVLTAIQSDKRVVESAISLLNKMQLSESTKQQRWDIDKVGRKKVLEYNYDRFERQRQDKIQELQAAPKNPVCDTCGQSVKNSAGKHNSAHLDYEKSKINPYTEQLANLELEQNPYVSGVNDFTEEIAEKNHEYEKYAQKEVELNLNLSDIDQLQGIVEVFRSTTIENTIRQVQDQTNQHLSEFFDSECQVEFTIEEADKLEVSLTKDGNKCVFSQLSKGQRQLLKLCFGVAIMKQVSNHHGFSPNVVTLDESFDGLDAQFKTKAFRLLETIAQSYETVLVVEHSSELKELFTNKFEIELINGHSQIEKM